MREELAFRSAGRAPDDILVASFPQFNLSDDIFVLPDLLVHPRKVKTYGLSGREALLVVEVADTSLEYDLRTKVPLYATHGVREYWVINAVTLMTTVHRQPAGNAYAFTEELPGEAQLVPSLAPALAVSLGALDLD
jgi:Uma2 family endonuclease